MRSAARAQPLAAPPPAGLLGFPPPPCGDPLRARLWTWNRTLEALGSLGGALASPAGPVHNSLPDRSGPNPMLWLKEGGGQLALSFSEAV